MNINFDLESNPLQVQTDSILGSGDTLWVRFVKLNTDDGPGITIHLTDPPSYDIGYCSQNNVFEIPSGHTYRIWTIRKQGSTGTIQLFCNGLEIFNFTYATSVSHQDSCKLMWSYDFEHIRFTEIPGVKDTASNYFRRLTAGRFKLQ